MNKLFLLTLCLFFSLSLMAGNMTKAYLFNKQYYNKKISHTDRFFKQLRPYKILLIPGVLSESFFKESNQKIKINFLLGEIFHDHEQFLQKYQLDYQKLILESEQSPAFNGKEIEKAILSSPKKLILFSHSKGGLDVLMAFKNNPSLLKKIKGWVTVQTPFYGSAVAEFFDKFKLGRKTAKWLFETLGGEIDGLRSLNLSVRKSFMKKKENQLLIKKILNSTRVINFGSFKPNTIGWDSPLELFRNYASFKKGKNDGVVHLKSAFLPGADFIIEKDVDHLLTVVNCNRIKTFSFKKPIGLKNKWVYDRVSHFKSLLYLISR